MIPKGLILLSLLPGYACKQLSLQVYVTTLSQRSAVDGTLGLVYARQVL